MSDKDNANSPVPVQASLADLLGDKDAFMSRVRKMTREHPLPAPVEEHAKTSAAALREEVAPGGKSRPEQAFLPFAPMPTDLCRVSPFFPMSRNEMAERQFVKDVVITKSAWGEITYTGPKLSISEEDALLALLAVLDAMRGDREAYVYNGPALPILKLMGYPRPGKNHYARLVDSLKIMTGAVFELRVKSGRRRFDNILSGGDYDSKTGNLQVTINPLFFEAYLAGSVTLLDVERRRKLRKAISKALYRFMQSHRNDVWEGHFLTLAAALNLNLENEPRELRRQIKEALAELKKNGMLNKASGFKRGSKDVVSLIRSAQGKAALKK